MMCWPVLCWPARDASVINPVAGFCSCTGRGSNQLSKPTAVGNTYINTTIMGANDQINSK